MQRVLVWIVVPWLVACGRLAFDAGGLPAGDDEAPVGDCPLVLNLDRAQIQEQLVDFPLLVRLGSEHLDRTQLQPDARNLAFYLDGAALAYEIEDAGDPVLAWVRVPVLSGAGLAIRVGYGAGTAAASQPVWSAAYAAVFHLAEPSGPPRDATGHYAAASIAELGSTPIAAVPGQIGGGRGFQSMRNHAVQIDALDLMYSPFTVSGWMYELVLPTSYHALVTREHATGADNFFWIGDHAGSYVGELYRSSGGLPLISNKPAAVDKWVHLALTATSAGIDSQATLFINGVVDLVQSVDGLPPPGTERPIVLGADNNSGAAEPRVDLLDGRLDEVRIETVARSSEWVRADYLSMTDQLIRYEVLPTAAPCDAPGD
ncbi:MAG TPA: LamG domain-containing protein [Kofleriaceae bacterium]|nr:LamG domain-containing protein [Kofleriaceae bacterium]